MMGPTEDEREEKRQKEYWRNVRSRRDYEDGQRSMKGEIQRLQSELTAARDEAERLRGRCGELEKVVDDGSDAWLLRKQAEALEACADGLPKSHATFVRLHNEAQRLRQQADEA